MRILEFDPGAYRNLATGPITFTFDPAGPLREGCSIRFLVGANGVGKTNILRFLTGIFLALDEDFRRPTASNPAYSVPFRLVYQLRQDTITVESRGQGRSGVRFIINTDTREPGDFPARDQILPATLLVYTSGDAIEWRNLFDQSSADAEEGASTVELDTLQLELEMPPDFLANPRDKSFVDNNNRTQIDTAAAQVKEETQEILGAPGRRICLVEQGQLKLALLTALLVAQARQASGQPVNDAFHTTLTEIKTRLIGFSFQIDPSLEDVALTQVQSYVLSRLYALSTLPLREWAWQRWVFDLASFNMEAAQSTLTALYESPFNEPFQLFQTLVELNKLNVLQYVDLVLNYTPPNGNESAARTLLTEGLSDGEFSFLARMALIYLLEEEECLFLLDEPEVHFNDDWKRNLVDNIEQALTDSKSEVILTSHASVTLTDAFPDEVILMGLHGQQPVPLTLGAEPGEILRRLFHAERTVGRRAMRRIEAIMKHGSDEALTALLDEVGAGFYRFKIVEELERRVSSA